MKALNKIQVKSPLNPPKQGNKASNNISRSAEGAAEIRMPLGAALVGHIEGYLAMALYLAYELKMPENFI